MTDQTPYFFAFSMAQGIGPLHFQRLLNVFKTPYAAYTAHVSELTPVLGELLAEKFRTFRSSFNPIAEYTDLLYKGIQYVSFESSLYPMLLRSISDPPIGLFVIGPTKTLTSSDHFLAIVGTRNPSDYGKYIAKKFAFELAGYGFTIVSGMAVGIDSLAHLGTIDANGTTIAVLGCGVDNIPPSRQSLYKRIIASGGAVISEFRPGEYVSKGFFVARNRIVSGMSNGVLVVEGTEKSGTLITAKYAALQGKDVFAPPVPITSTLSQAPNILLKQGAILATSVADILEEFNVNVHQQAHEDILRNRSENDKAILVQLTTQPLSPDSLSKKTALPITTILTIISILEIEGIVKKQADGKYTICYA